MKSYLMKIKYLVKCIIKNIINKRYFSSYTMNIVCKYINKKSNVIYFDNHIFNKLKFKLLKQNIVFSGINS